MIINKLQENAVTFRSLLEHVTPEEYSWRSAPEKWNLLEIVSHLHDEEREDFRTRLRSTLEDPSNDFPPIDPAAWVKERNYAGNDYHEKLNAFLEERKHSVDWLKTLGNVNWKNAYAHKKFGSMSAEMFLAEWNSHDLLHLKQIIHTRYQYHRIQSGEPLPYAGNW